MPTGYYKAVQIVENEITMLKDDLTKEEKQTIRSVLDLLSHYPEIFKDSE